MRYLVLTKPLFPWPPDKVGAFMESLIAWGRKYQAIGQMEDIWCYSGKPGGGGILNVQSHDEFNNIMIEFPLFQFSDTECIPISDFEQTIIKQVQIMKDMMG